MRNTAIALTSALALALTACGGSGGEASLKGEPIAAVKAPEGSSWTSTIAKTERGYLMGNPDAKLKFVEYAAVTCPGCAQFHRDSDKELKAMVETGVVSFELRPFLVHGLQDVAGFSLAKCNGPEAFFGLTGRLFDDQMSWLGKLQTGLTEADQRAYEAADMKGKINFFAAKFELVDFVKQLGVSEDAAKACLADDKAREELIAQTERISEEGKVTGTPTVMINDVVVNPASWNVVKNSLQQAGAR